MKKIVAICLSILTLFVMSACGSSISYDDYDLKEYIKVGDYKGIKVAPYSISVTEDEIDARIETIMQNAATSKDLDNNTAVKNGDTVNIDYVGKIKGKEFDGGSAQGTDLVIGSGTFIEGFEDGIIGKMVGDKFDLNLTFPKDYGNEELNGKDVVFSVKINSATREEVPEYGLDFVQNTTEFNTIEEYERELEKQIYNEKEQQEIENQKLTIWSELLENTKVKKYPEKELEYYIEFNSNQMDEMAKSYGMSRDEMLATYEFGDEDEFKAVNEDSSKLRIKQEMLIKYIADKEKLEYTDKEKAKMIESFENAGYDDKTIEQQTGHDMEAYAHMELMYQKVLDFLLENANITGAPEKSE